MEIDEEEPRRVQQVRDSTCNEECSHFGAHTSWEMLHDLGDFGLTTNRRGMEFARGKVNGEEVIQKSAPKKLLLREATIYRELFHEQGAPFVMLARAVLEENDHIYVTLPHCRAGDLIQKCRAERPLPPLFIKKASRQLLAGVDFLHSRNIGHMDLSLENLLLTEQEDLRIMDFDLSVKLRDDDGSLKLYRSLCGKTYTRAPEVLVASGLITDEAVGLPWQRSYAAAPVDAFACGAIIFTLLAGRTMWSNLDRGEGLIKAGEVPTTQCWVKALMKRRNPDAFRHQTAAPALLQGLLHLQPKFRTTPADALQRKWLLEPVERAAAVSAPPRPQATWLATLRAEDGLAMPRL